MHRKVSFKEIAEYSGLENCRYSGQTDWGGVSETEKD